MVLTVALLFLLGDAPGQRHVRGPQLSLSSVRQNLADSWAQPGTRLGFWMHFTSQFSATTMSLLWGYPFFVRGEGRSPATAGLLLTLIVVAIMASGPILGWLVGAHPWHRSTMVLSIVAPSWRRGPPYSLWPGNAPLWLLVALVVFAGLGGPASIIGFDVGRTSNPAHRLGAATGIINQGGFYASLFLVVAIGLVLDWRTPGSGTDYPAVGVPLGDERAVPALGRRAGADLALPRPHPRAHPPAAGRGGRARAGDRPPLTPCRAAGTVGVSSSRASRRRCPWRASRCAFDAVSTLALRHLLELGGERGELLRVGALGDLALLHLGDVGEARCRRP